MVDAETKEIMALNEYVKNWDAANRKILENTLWNITKSAETAAITAKEEWDKADKREKACEVKLKSCYQDINLYILFWEKYCKKLGNPQKGKKLYNKFFATL